ncbi:hypothetical protein FKM82_024711 [Ascaphus truei]
MVDIGRLDRYPLAHTSGKETSEISQWITITASVHPPLFWSSDFPQEPLVKGLAPLVAELRKMGIKIILYPYLDDLLVKLQDRY